MLHIAKRISARFIKNSAGASGIEFAVILPLFILLSLGAIEFGLYFVKSEISNTAVSSISQSIQRDQNYYANMTTSQINALLVGYGSGLVKFAPVGSNTGNIICVDAYKTAAEAEAAGNCGTTHFNTTNPNPAPPVGTPPNPYYIAVRADLQRGTVTPFGKFVKATQNMQVVQSAGSVVVGTLTPPVCNKQGDALQWNGTQFVCTSLIPPQCNAPWKKLQYDAKTGFTCPTVPYVIAGGVAWPTTDRGGDYTTADNSNTTNNGSHSLNNVSNTWLICQDTTKFQIPTGLPKGIIVAQGNLIYPTGSPDTGDLCNTSSQYGCGGDGFWHSWVISFRHLNAPVGGGTGSMDVCLDHGGNYQNSISGIASEHVDWSVIFIPQ